jgi:hypothetical protein
VLCMDPSTAAKRLKLQQYTSDDLPAILENTF